MARDSFIFYRSYYEAMSGLKDKDKLQLFKAISELSLNNNEVQLTGICKNIFIAIKPQIVANSERYENGKKGGRPKKETTGFAKTKTTGFENKKPNKNENDNENVNENNNNNNAIDSCVDGLQDVIDFYNDNVSSLTPFSLSLLEDYVKEMGKDIVIYAMQISVEANKRTIQYIKAILNNWQKAGIKTLLEAQEESKRSKSNTSENKTNTKKQYQNYEQRKYDNLNELYTNPT